MNYYHVLAKLGKGPIEILAALADDEKGAREHIAKWAPGYNIQEVKLIAEGEKKECPKDASTPAAPENTTSDATGSETAKSTVNSGAPDTSSEKTAE